MVLPDSRRVPRVPRYSGAACAAFDFGYRAVTVYGQAFQPVLLSNHGSRNGGPTTPHLPKEMRFGLIPVRSPLLGKSLLISFPEGTLDVSVPLVCLMSLFYSEHDDTVLAVPGYPIRKSPDQRMFSSSPRLIAAGHVLHRRLAPRHPPSALSSLTTIYFGLNVLMRLHYISD